MPFSAPHPCGSPGCPVLVGRGKTRCATHERQAEAERGSAHSRGYDARWNRARLHFLKQQGNQFCVTCKAGDCDHRDSAGKKIGPHLKPADVVDHVVAHKGDQTLFWDEKNWRPSCKFCHDKRTDEGDFGRTP